MEQNNIFTKLIGFYQKRYLELAGYKAPENDPPMREMLDHLVNIPDLVYGRYAFLREPVAGRLSDDKKDELILKAIEEGEAYAEEYRKKFGDISLLQMAEKLGIEVSFPKIPAKGGNVRFAEFETPNKMRIFTDTFDKANALIEQEKLKKRMKNIDIQEVLIGHELYHYVENENKDTIFSLNHREVIWNIGAFKYDSHISVLPEIAAMSFSKKLNGIPFSPYLFDVFLTYSYNKELGIVTYNKIIQLMENYKSTRK
ncbi:MAG: hypothetical protein IJI66_00910 [Erysipelotrichaceae bacterium]|nr:hypothetical protein [Erysipelotrichaceae bacterium]